MKKFPFLTLTLIFISTTCFGQLLRKLDASEAPFNKMTETERAFVNHYSEANRWEVFLKSQLSELTTTGPTFSPVWENLGPNTIDTLAGRMLCLDFHPDNPSILFAGSGAGGLWKTENGGASWFPLTDDLPSMRVSAVAVNPNNPQEILIGTGIGRLLTTALQPGVGVLKSTDGGETWKRTSFSFNLTDIVSTYKLVYDPFIENKVYLAATNGFYISNDGGETWMTTNTARIYDIEVHPSIEGILFIGTQFIGIQKSTDGGLSWSTLASGLPSGSQVFRADIAICHNQPDHLVAKLINNNTFGSGGVFKSDDGGNSWSAVPNAPDVACQPTNPNACSGWLFNTVGIAPDDPDKIFLGGVQFWYTHNGGDTWIWKDYASNGSSGGNKNLVYVDHWDIDFDLDHNGRLYVCCDGGVIKSDDYGVTWTRLANGLINGMVYSCATSPSNPDFMIGGLHDHGLQRWDGNGGNLTWTRWSFNDGVKTLIDPKNPGVIYGNTQFGPVIKSFDNGAGGIFSSFLVTSGIQESGPWISPLVMNYENTNILFTASTARIYKTTNGATTWSIAANIPNVQTLEIDRHDPNIIYAHTFDPNNVNNWSFHKSMNGGSFWTRINNNSIPEWGTTAIISDPHQVDKIYATTNNPPANSGRIKVSEDGGNNWTDITNDFPDIKINDLLISPYNPNHLFLATDLGVYFSDNAGADWCPFNNNLPRIYSMDLSISEGDSTLRVATYGRGVWKTSLKEVSTSTFIPDVLEKYVDIDIFPNPVQSQMTIKIYVPVASNVQIDLFDQQGKKVKQLLRTRDKLERHEETFILNKELASGIYYVKILLGNNVYHRKIILK